LLAGWISSCNFANDQLTKNKKKYDRVWLHYGAMPEVSLAEVGGNRIESLQGDD
jgi:hypothetical protein